MTTQENGNGVPADGYFGTSAGNPLMDGSKGVPSPFGSPDSIWCKAVKALTRATKDRNIALDQINLAHEYIGVQKCALRHEIWVLKSKISRLTAELAIASQ